MGIKFKKFLCMCMFIGLTAPLSAFSFIPLTLAALGLPFLGMAGSSAAKKGVKKTLENVDDAVFYVRLFLLAFSILLFIIVVFWLIRTLKKVLQRRKIYDVIAILHRIQADLVLLKEESILPAEHLLDLSLSKKEAVGLLKQSLQYKFFQKRLGFHAFNRMHETILLLENEKIALRNQLIIVDQWLKTFDLLSR